MSEQSVGQQARSGVFSNFFSTTGVRILRTLVFVALARVLAPSDFGLVALASFFTAALLILVDCGFGQLLVQRREINTEIESTAFWFSLGAGTILTLVLFGTSGVIAGALGEEALTQVLRALSP